MKKGAWAFSPSVTFPATLDNVCLRCLQNEKNSAQGKHSNYFTFSSIFREVIIFSPVDCTLSFILTWRLSFYFLGSIANTIIQEYKRRLRHMKIIANMIFDPPFFARSINLKHRIKNGQNINSLSMCQFSGWKLRGAKLFLRWCELS